MLKDLINWDIDKKQVLKWDQISNIVKHNQSSLLPQIPQIVRFIQFLLLFYCFQIGTFSMAMAAKAFNKPVYVAAESFKFSNLYPLNQRDIPNEYSVSAIITLWVPYGIKSPGMSWNVYVVWMHTIPKFACLILSS